MIEIIYKDETKKDNTDTVIKLPKNIRQIGEGNSDYQIYSPRNDMTYLSRIHLDNFAGNDKVYLRIDRIEEEENFFIYSGTGLKRQSGYHIFYEKCYEMEDYIYGSNKKNYLEDVSVAKKDKSGGVIAPAEEKNNNQAVLKKTGIDSTARKISKNIASILTIHVLAGTIALVSNEKTMENVKSKIGELLGGSEGETGLEIPVAGIINETGEEDTSKSELPSDEESKSGENNGENTTKPEPIASVTVPQNYYTIQAGDTIYKIAMKFYNNESMIEQIKNANNIVNEDHV